jgi:uncharacterized RDD family membrane protein YckC
MNKKEFLRELENSLSEQLPREDLNEILSDYRDVFDNGLAEGKTEDEIADEIGSPAMIVRRVLEGFKEVVAPVTTAPDANLAPMSKRLGAYIIDTFTTSLLLALILFTSTFPFYSITARTNMGEPNTSGGYKQRLIFRKDGTLKRIELLKNNKRLFRGTNEQYERFLNENKIDFTQITSYERVSHSAQGMGMVNFIAVFPLTMMLMFFGLSNLITAFQVWIFKGYTLGKWLTKIRVVRLDGEKITLWDAFLRDGLIKAIGNSATSGILNIGSFIWGAATPEHKTVHDLVVKTKVVNAAR